MKTSKYTFKDEMSSRSSDYLFDVCNTIIKQTHLTQTHTHTCTKRERERRTLDCIFAFACNM